MLNVYVSLSPSLREVAPPVKAIVGGSSTHATEIETVAAGAAQDMVGRLTGIKVDKKDAAAAVKAELNV